jgi:hypothetical protein
MARFRLSIEDHKTRTALKVELIGTTGFAATAEVATRAGGVDEISGVARCFSPRGSIPVRGLKHRATPDIGRLFTTRNSI